VTGVRYALEPGRGSTAVPVRTTLLGAVVAVTAVVASLVFAASLHHLGSTPRLYGWDWDARINTDGGRDFGLVNARLAKDRDVAAFSAGDNSRIAVGNRSIPAIGVDPAGGVHPTISKGRAPTADGEIALGIRTMDDLGVGVGDHVKVTYGRRSQSMTVVGRAVFPSFGTYEGSDKTELGTGAMLTRHDLRRLAPSFEKTFHLVRFTGGTNRAAALRRIRSWAPEDADNTFVQVLGRPTDIVNYRRVGQTPLILAAVLALLAAATVAHALITSVRKRRRDIAVLRALGFGRGAVSATVAWQATTLVGVALLVGVPVGVAAGRWAWTVLAQRLGAVVEPETPTLAVALLVPGALVLANVVGAFPGWLAGRVRPALALRTE
jgi:hypothetical protein